MNKLSKTIRKAEKVGSDNSLHSNAKKVVKNVKIMKQDHAFKEYASTYNVDILNYFNTEVQLKDTEFIIKSKLLELLTQLNGFKFVTTSVLAFEKTES